MRKARERIHGGVATTGVLRDLGTFAVIAGLLAVHAWAHVEGTLAGYRLSAAQHEQHELRREGEALRLELATRRAAARIETDAREKLGMVEPSPDRIVPIGGAARRAPSALASRGGER